MRKPKHEWEDVYINPELNGVDPDTNEIRRYFDPWSHFRRCITCGRVEEIDYDAICDIDDQEYRLDGWFVTYTGDTSKCYQQPTIGYHVYFDKTIPTVKLRNGISMYASYAQNNGKDIQELLNDLVTEDVWSNYYKERYGVHE